MVLTRRHAIATTIARRISVLGARHPEEEREKVMPTPLMDMIIMVDGPLERTSNPLLISGSLVLEAVEVSTANLVLLGMQPRSPRLKVKLKAMVDQAAKEVERVVTAHSRVTTAA